MLCLSAIVAAAAPQRSPVFRADANLVPIDIQVIDKETLQPLPRLERSDFLVLDEGEPSEIIAFDNLPAPLNILLLLDVSGGFTNEGVLGTTYALRKLLLPDDRVAFMSFSDGDAKRRSGFTNDPQEIQRAYSEIFNKDRNNSRRAVKNSHLFDAIRSAVNLFSEVPAMRRPVIVVVSHNREIGSTAKAQAVIDTLLQSSLRLEAVTIPQQWAGRTVPFIGIGIPGRTPPRRPNASPEFLDDLGSVEPIAKATGGETMQLDYPNPTRVPRGTPSGSGWLSPEIATLLDDNLMARLRAQYSLGIRGVVEERRFRRLEVRLTDDARKRHPNAIIRARSGYFTAVGP